MAGSPTQVLRRKLQLSALGLGGNEAVSEQVCQAAAAFEFSEMGPLDSEMAGKGVPVCGRVCPTTTTTTGGRVDFYAYAENADFDPCREAFFADFGAQGMSPLLLLVERSLAIMRGAQAG